MLIRRVLLASFLAAWFAATLVQPAAAAEPPKPAVAPPAGAAQVSPHHKGLRGEPSPHNGWASYSQLTLDLGTDRYFVYDQAAGEFSATVIERRSEVIKIRAISIPGAGIFYYPAEASPCAPDALERVGLFAERLLFYLSSAFPAGPASIDATASGVVDRAVPELHFMDGLMKPHESSRTLVSVALVGPGQIQYVLQDDRDKVRGVWRTSRARAVIPDDEALLEWNVCWAGSWSSRAGGASSFKPRLANATELKTFGDVRKALRASRRPGKK